MKKIRDVFRIIYNKINQLRLKNENFSLIASNCNGASILNDLGQRFNSPFVNLWMKPGEFIKFLSNLNYYLSCELLFVKEESISYPIGLLADIRIYFQHYNSEELAKKKWDDRKKRINFDNLFILFTDRDGCSYQNLLDFDNLPYKNKIVFTHIPYPEFKSAYYIKGFENCESVGMCFKFKSNHSFKKYYDDFDYVDWFNKGK